MLKFRISSIQTNYLVDLAIKAEALRKPPPTKIKFKKKTMDYKCPYQPDIAFAQISSSEWTAHCLSKCTNYR